MTDPRMTPTNDAPVTVERLKPQYPDYLDDPDGLARFRQDVRQTPGHDMAKVNHNSLGRLIDTIERLRSERDRLAALASAPADDEETYTRWLAGDETLSPLSREQYLRFQARSDRAIKNRQSAPAVGGMEEVRRNPDDCEWTYCPACKTGFLDTGYECNSCGFDAQPLVDLQSACEERSERMHPSGLYESEIANPIRQTSLASAPAGDGDVLMPRHATRAMVDAADACTDAYSAYNAMVEAAHVR